MMTEEKNNNTVLFYVERLTQLYDVMGASKYQQIVVSEEFFNKIKEEIISVEKIYGRSEQILFEINNYNIAFIKSIK